MSTIKQSVFGLIVLTLFTLAPPVLAQKTVSVTGANSTQNDWNPVWLGDGRLLFTRAFHPENLGGKSDRGDIWMIEKDENGKWGEAIHRADLSTSGYDLALGMPNVITLLVFHEEGNGNRGIHEYAKFGRDWNYRRRLEVPKIDEFSGLVSGSVVDGKLIFLSGETPDSMGNEDLYVFELVFGITWSEPINLGTVVNTFGEEVSPLFDSKTQRLYYSTNNRPDAEGKDVYVALKTGDSWQDWSNPIRWDQINSAGSESGLAIIAENEVVWGSSQNSGGFFDLRSFAREVELDIPSDFEPALRRSLARESAEISAPEKSVTYLTEEKIKPISPKIMVGKPEIGLFLDSVLLESRPLVWIAVDAKEKIELDFTVEFMSKKNPVTFSEIDSILYADLLSKGVDEVKVSSPGYFPFTFSTDELIVDQPNIALMAKVQKGQSIKLEKVAFSRGTAEFEGLDTELALKELSTFLLENKELSVRIHGHTDSSGDPGLNKALSLERARAVRDYLVDLGVDFERLRISGWGGTRPIASNATEAGRQKNRRVELEVQ